MSLNDIFCDEAITEQIPLVEFLPKAGKVFGSPNIDSLTFFLPLCLGQQMMAYLNWIICGNSLLSGHFRALNSAVNRILIFGTIIAIHAIAASVNHLSLLRNLLHVPPKTIVVTHGPNGVAHVVKADKTSIDDHTVKPANS